MKQILTVSIVSKFNGGPSDSFCVKPNVFSRMHLLNVNRFSHVDDRILDQKWRTFRWEFSWINWFFKNEVSLIKRLRFLEFKQIRNEQNFDTKGVLRKGERRSTLSSNLRWYILISTYKGGSRSAGTTRVSILYLSSCIRIDLIDLKYIQWFDQVKSFDTNI